MCLFLHCSRKAFLNFLFPLQNFYFSLSPYHPSPYLSPIFIHFATFYQNFTINPPYLTFITLFYFSSLSKKEQGQHNSPPLFYPCPLICCIVVDNPFLKLCCQLKANVHTKYQISNGISKVVKMKTLGDAQNESIIIYPPILPLVERICIFCTFYLGKGEEYLAVSRDPLGDHSIPRPLILDKNN